MLVVRARKSEESEMKLECLTPEFPQGARVYSVDGVAPSLLNSASAMRSQAILVSGGGESDFSSFKIWMKLRKNFNPPVRWEAVQDKRRNPKPLGRNTYLYKARKIKSLARSTHTRASLHKGKQKGTEEQCKHTFKITAARCAPCSGYNVECKHYEKNSAADTKHGSSRT